LFAGELYVLRGAHPERRAFAFIAGVFIVMVVGGLLLAGGLTRWVAAYFSRLPDEVWLLAQVALGLDSCSLVFPTAHTQMCGRSVSLQVACSVRFFSGRC
jgi:hypothetical protein